MRRAWVATLLLLLLCLLHPHASHAEEQQGEAAAADGEQEVPEEEEALADGSYFKFRGPEWHPQSFGTTQCTAPTPQLNESGNIFDCRILRDTCVDQGVIIYQDQRFHPWTSEVRLQVFNVSDILWNTPSLLGIGDKWKIGKNRYHNPHMRPWHHMEESEDIRKPVFSNCTVPLLFYHHFPFNVAEVYRFAVNNIYFMQQRLKFFDEHITLVPATPYMSRVPSYTSFWLQPFSRYAVTSLGNLSQRRSPGAPSAATGEGAAVRCFSRFMMCKITLRKPTGAFFDAGQFVAEYYLKQAAPHEANFTARLAQSMSREDLYDVSVLKVVFAVRSKSHKDIGRVLINEDELIDRCNRQDVKLPADANVSAFRTIRCIRHVFGVDNLYDMWLVRQMDVLVGVHGSALTNAMFMRRGSSLIELRPFGFSGRESWPNIYMKSQTRRMEVFWFGIDVMNASLSTPGDFEADMQPIYTRSKGCLARDRNLAVPWAALAHQLLNVAVVSRSVARYKVLRYSHAYYVTHDLQAVEVPGKDKFAHKELLSWFTDLDAERNRAAAIPLTPEGEAAAARAEEARLEEIRHKKEQEAEAAAAAAAGVGADAEVAAAQGAAGRAGEAAAGAGVATGATEGQAAAMAEGQAAQHQAQQQVQPQVEQAQAGAVKGQQAQGQQVAVAPVVAAAVGAAGAQQAQGQGQAGQLQQGAVAAGTGVQDGRQGQGQQQAAAIVGQQAPSQGQTAGQAQGQGQAVQQGQQAQEQAQTQSAGQGQTAWQAAAAAQSGDGGVAQQVMLAGVRQGAGVGVHLAGGSRVRDGAGLARLRSRQGGLGSRKRVRDPQGTGDGA